MEVPSTVTDYLNHYDEAVYNMALDLLDNEYYDYVEIGIIEEAVKTTHKETGMSLTRDNLEKYHEYISENLI